MNVAEQARQTYARAAAPIHSPRQSEYAVIGKITHQLKDAALRKDIDFPAFASALHKNRSLWATLAVDIASPDNGLPDDLRARLFWLAEFTDAETARILRGKGDIAALIEVNAAVLHGLGQGGSKP